ncbi:MAG: hypothetical protein V1856_01595 [Candidatus Liptonbacteria bacterium]
MRLLRVMFLILIPPVMFVYFWSAIAAWFGNSPFLELLQTTSWRGMVFQCLELMMIAIVASWATLLACLALAVGWEIVVYQRRKKVAA